MEERLAKIRERIRAGSFTKDASIQESLIKVCDKADRCLKYDISGHSGFLNENVCVMADRILAGIPNSTYIITGGYKDAERKIILFLPFREDVPVIPISLLRLSFTVQRISHRDILGSLMSMGIRRDCIGDILPSEYSADVLVLCEIASYLCMNVDKIGRNRCRCEEIPLEMIRVPEMQVKTIRGTVSSLRLDSILTVAFDISRSEASVLIKAGKVAINGCETIRCSDAIESDTTISCRGYGKCRFICSNGLSKKGRIRITVEKYL